MQQRAISLATVAALGLNVSGCAYMTNYTQPVDLRNGSISIDVKQRVVFSQNRSDVTVVEDGKTTTFKRTVVCAEPSPDALTVLGASGGLSINTAKGQIGNAGFALAEQGASIGLRTQSIQLLRDAMYRLCEGYAAGSVSDADFAAMQRRYQSTMMGLIAIEQLTGPVVAAQAMLNTRASASAGAGAGDAGVDRAQTKLNEAEDAVLNAEKEFATSKQAVADKSKTLSSKRDELVLESKKKEPDETAKKALSDQIATLEREETSAKLDEGDKQRRLAVALDRRKQAQLALTQAQAKVASAADGSGTLSVAAAHASAMTTKDFARTVQGIVHEINNSYTRDSCVALITTLVTDPKLLPRLQAFDMSQLEQLAAKTKEIALQATSAGEAATRAARQSALPSPAASAANAAGAEAEKQGAAVLKASEDVTSAVAVLRTTLKLCDRVMTAPAPPLAEKGEEASASPTAGVPSTGEKRIADTPKIRTATPS